MLTDLWGKERQCPTNEAKRGIHSLLPICRQMSSHHLESKASAYLTIACEDKCTYHHCSNFLLFSVLLLSMALNNMEYLFSKYSSEPPNPFHYSWCTSSGGMVDRTWNSLGALLTLSSHGQNKVALRSPQCAFVTDAQHNIIQTARKKGKSIPARTSTHIYPMLITFLNNFHKTFFLPNFSIISITWK